MKYALKGIIGIILIGYFCGCTYSESYSSSDEYITIYDKDWNTKFYGKVRRENE